MFGVKDADIFVQLDSIYPTAAPKRLGVLSMPACVPRYPWSRISHAPVGLVGPDHLP